MPNMPSDAVLRKEACGPLADLIRRLSDPSGERTLEALRLFMRLSPNEALKKLKSTKDLTWKKLLVGGETFSTLTARCLQEKMVVHERATILAGALYKSLPFFDSVFQEEVEFVKGSLSELFLFEEDIPGNGRQEVNFQDFLNEEFLAEHELKFCEVYDAGYLRLAWPEQTSRWLADHVRIGTKPLYDDSTDRPMGFTLDKFHLGAESKLYLGPVFPERPIDFNPRSQWIFRRK